MPFGKQPKLFPLKNIMTKDVISVQPDTLIFDAIQLLAKCAVSGLPVINDENALVGILTEKDVLKILSMEKITYNDSVSKYMTKDVVSFKPEDSAIDVCRFFQRNPIRRVPIVDKGKVVGIVSRHDIISLILEAKSNFASYRFS